ncbi:hypothetical protein Pla52n_29370 [Stieleria varia]|uniref:Uncharacterized protein n=1 Tax=Stieleria varia TaxID=2528005 RepID=A0A5C6B0H3_9BACT|nr:hypothetical protein Pla52n_29370 [Stieleria varia]
MVCDDHVESTPQGVVAGFSESGLRPPPGSVLVRPNEPAMIASLYRRLPSETASRSYAATILLKSRETLLRDEFTLPRCRLVLGVTSLCFSPATLGSSPCSSSPSPRPPLSGIFEKGKGVFSFRAGGGEVNAIVLRVAASCCSEPGQARRKQRIHLT